MNTVLSSYTAARKFSKKVVIFFVVGLTYGCRKSWKRICGISKSLSRFPNCEDTHGAEIGAHPALPQQGHCHSKACPPLLPVLSVLLAWQAV